MQMNIFVELALV